MAPCKGRAPGVTRGRSTNSGVVASFCLQPTHKAAVFSSACEVTSQVSSSPAPIVIAPVALGAPEALDSKKCAVYAFGAVMHFEGLTLWPRGRMVCCRSGCSHSCLSGLPRLRHQVMGAVVEHLHDRGVRLEPRDIRLRHCSQEVSRSLSAVSTKTALSHSTCISQHKAHMHRTGASALITELTECRFWQGGRPTPWGSCSIFSHTRQEAPARAATTAYTSCAYLTCASAPDPLRCLVQTSQRL